MKKIKYRNNNYNNQVYSINYKFDSVSPAGKFCGTALDLIKRYNELAKEAQANGNYVEAEVFRQYAEHYRKIITEINERKNVRFNNKENENRNAPPPVEDDETSSGASSEEVADTEVQPTEEKNNKEEGSLVETKAKSAKKSFTVIEVADENKKTKRTYKPRVKKEVSEPVVNV